VSKINKSNWTGMSSDNIKLHDNSKRKMKRRSGSDRKNWAINTVHNCIIIEHWASAEDFIIGLISSYL
jgi:hypothetical protein